jgi:hypothetical protein
MPKEAGIVGKQKGQLSRRDVLKGAAVGALASGAVLPAEAAQRRSNVISRENELPGASNWQLTYTKVDPATRYRCPWIEGYVSHASIKAGEKLDLMVSTNPAGRFEVDIYRMGFYGGDGARHMLHLGPFDGSVQPDPPVGPERLRECQWTPCTSIEIPKDWPSGVYLGKLSLVDDRWQSYVVFIVKDERKADIVFQCSDNTWQAYNRWPDNYALYDDGQSQWALKPGIRVSYDRPYGKYCQILDAPLSQGSGEFLLWEYPLAYWLEREGYDVTYISNTDTHASADTLLRAKTVISVGHDEYWSLEQFEHMKAAVDAGVNVLFLSGNTSCFVAPMGESTNGCPHRTLTRAGRYGGLMEAEKEKMGPFPMDGPNEATLIGARTISPYNGSGDWIVSDPDCWIFEGTGMKKGDSIPGLVGWEFHGDPAPIPGLRIVAEGEALNAGNEVAHWTATLYPGPKGNHVFNASTIWWAQALATPPGHMLPYSHFGRPHGPDERVERITRNLLERASA